MDEPLTDEKLDEMILAAITASRSLPVEGMRVRSDPDLHLQQDGRAYMIFRGDSCLEVWRNGECIEFVTPGELERRFPQAFGKVSSPKT